MRQIEGRNAVFEAVKAKSKIKKIFVQKDINDEKIIQIKKEAEKTTGIEIVSKKKLDSMSRTKRHQGVIALAEDFPKIKIKELIESIYAKKEIPLITAASGVEYEHNLGSLLRSSECFGAHAVILPKKSFGLSPVVIKASSGASEHIPLIKKDIYSALKLLREKGLKIVALSEKSGKKISEINLKCPLCLLIGSENKGINKSLSKYIDEYAKITMKGKINSLNMAAAASIGLYEAVRQRELLKEELKK